jgi:hypothetical protein
MKENRLNKEISARLNSEIWDYKTASSVIARRRQKTEKMLTRGSFISTAVAAIAVFVFIFDLTTTPTGSSYTEAYYQVSTDTETGLYATAEVDYIINEAYPMR